MGSGVVGTQQEKQDKRLRDWEMVKSIQYTKISFKIADVNFFFKWITCEANKKKAHTPFTLLELSYTPFGSHALC